MLTLGSLFDGSGGFPLAAKKGTQCTDKQTLIENHMRDARYKESETAPCLTATAGTGGNNQPYVVSETVTFSKVHGTVSAADGPKGIHSQIQKDPESFFVAECYNVCSAGSNTSNMAYKTDVSKTLDLHSVSANCNQGGTVCVENFTMSKDNRQTQFLKDTAFCLYASDYKDPQAFNDNMFVRRLTPLEYCRLQGFPDKWLKNPFTDSAAYKMWGNGVALPVVFYILNTLNNYVHKESL